MARNYGTKQKVITWDVKDANGAAAPLLLNSTNLGFDPNRRGMLISISGSSVGGADMTGTKFYLQAGIQDSAGVTTYMDIPAYASPRAATTELTGAQQYWIDSIADIMAVRPRNLRLNVDLNAKDAGTVIKPLFPLSP